MQKVSLQNNSSKPAAKSRVVLFACIAAVCLLIAFVGLIAGTLCALSDDQKHLNYDSYFDGYLIENDDLVGETEVYPAYSEPITAIAQNGGSLPMYARMQYDKYWVEKQGDSWVKSSDSSLNAEYIELSIDESSGWVDGGDGWYYYLQQIAPSAQSASFLKTMTFSTEIGQNNNDNNNHQVSSEYVGKGAQVDVFLECVSEPPPVVAENKNSNASTVVSSSPTSSNASASQLKKYFVSNTSDDISLLVYTIFAFSICALIASVCFFIAAKRHQKNEENNTHVYSYTM